MIDEILDERVVSSRHRIKPRGVKRKMSNYPLRPRDFVIREYDPETIVKIVK